MDKLMTTQRDLTFAAPAAVTTSRIYCRVCNLVTTVPIDAPALLCVHCHSDLEATARHIADRLEAAERHAAETYERLSADVAHADTDDQERFGRAVGALANVHAGQMSMGAFTARLNKTLSLYPGMRPLWAAWEAWDAAVGNVEQVREWAERAMGEVEAAR
jgi:hypothetical protein